MAISSAGLFNHELVIARDASGAWSGEAAPRREGARHPGLVGEQPQVTLSGGVVTLRRRASILDLFNSHCRRGDNLAGRASFRVGDALEAVAEDGDLLRVARFGTGDFAATLFRRGHLVIGLGALLATPLGDAISIEEDPRAHEVRFYHLATDIHRPGTIVAWIDSADPNVDAAIQRLAQLPGNRSIIAIAGTDPVRQMEVHHRVAGQSLGGHSSREYVAVPSRFSTRAEWYSYLEQLPKSRPTDMYVRFRLGGLEVDVREDRYAFSSPWHLHVAKIYRWGTPGEMSQLAIAQSHPALDGRMVMESARQIVSGRFDFSR